MMPPPGCSAGNPGRGRPRTPSRHFARPAGGSTVRRSGPNPYPFPKNEGRGVRENDGLAGREEKPDESLMQYMIELEHEADIAGVDEHALERLAAHALGVEGVAKPSELSVLLADD